MNIKLLTSLEQARWGIISHTYGSSHCTLIGLLVDWWITNPTEESHWVLESGLPYEKQKRCDAILVEKDSFKGIVEVEGSRHEYTMKKMMKYFTSDYRECSSLQFGIFLAYGYGCEPESWKKYMDKFVEWGKEMTKPLREKHPGKQLVILALDKACEQKKLGSHRLGEYCRTPHQVRGTIIQDGEVLIPPRSIWSRQS